MISKSLRARPGTPGPVMVSPPPSADFAPARRRTLLDAPARRASTGPRPPRRARPLWAWLVLVAVLPVATARAGTPLSAASATARTLKQRLGGEVHVRDVDASGRVREVRGRTLPITRDPARDGARAVRSFLAANTDLFGGSARSLVRPRVTELRLVGTTPKVIVTYEQEDSGLVVRGAHASVLLDAQGCVLAVQSTLADIGRSASGRLLTASAAAACAVQAAGGGVPDAVDAVLAAPSGERVAHEAYEVRVTRPFAAEPEGETLLIDAQTGAVIDRHPSVYHADLTGTLRGYYSTNLLPDVASNPEVQADLEGALLTGPLGTTVSAANGSWTLLASGSSPQAVIATLSSSRATVINQGGGNISVSGQTTPGSPITLVLNQGRTENETAQMNALAAIVRFQNWLHSIDPLDTTMDFQVVANVNIASTCNAYWNGSSINFYHSGGGCVNTSYSTVVAHELGHWANDRYNGGVTGAFHEGAADVWSMYIHDTPVVGQDFAGTGSYIRTGTNTTLYCGNDLESCHGGEVHKEGEPLMGAFWKMRARLDSALGDAAGDAVANALFVGWMQSFDDTKISAVIEDHLLILDDDNGNIYDGTPHFAQIDGGFRDQGFPGLDESHVTIDHTPPAASSSGAPVPLTAVIASLDGTPISAAWIRYSTDRGGSYTPVAMAPTGAPDTYQGTIPAQAAGTTVWYYLDASNSGGSSSVLPASAPVQDRFFYYVGYAMETCRFGFEGTTDAGWTHGAIWGTDDWERAAPQGKGGDPAAAASGSKAFGNDLTGDGKYASFNRTVLTSPTFDLGQVTGTRLAFRRWLGSEDGIYDHASVKVNGTTVWTTPSGDGDDNLIDTDWTHQEIDISSIADNNANVQITFEMMSDELYNFGGWTIDDVVLYNVVPQNLGCAPASDDEDGSPGSGGYVPNIYLAQGAPVLGNTSLLVKGDQLKGGAVCLLILGAYPANLAFDGIRLKVDPLQPHALFVRVASGSGNGQGRASVALPIPNVPAFAGFDIHLQWIVLDPGTPFGLAASGGLTVPICGG